MTYLMSFAPYKVQSWLESYGLYKGGTILAVMKTIFGKSQVPIVIIYLDDVHT